MTGTMATAGLMGDKLSVIMSLNSRGIENRRRIYFFHYVQSFGAYFATISCIWPRRAAMV